jgi:hypothetical protein
MSSLSLSKSLSISLSLGVPACVSGGGDALLAGADENSWQSRPRHACASSAFHTPSSRLHAPCAIQQQATVMVLLEASAIARNVGRDLVFAASRRAACSHSDLGCANYGAEALPWRSGCTCRRLTHWRVSDTPLWRAAVRSRTEGTAKPRAPLQCRIPCQACAASAFFCRPGSGAQSVGRRTVPSSKPTPRPKSTRMPGLDCHEFSSAPSHARMQTFGGRCSCTSSVRSTQTASSQQHSPQYSQRS